MKKAYLFSIFLFVSFYMLAQPGEEQNQQTPPPDLSTTANAQRAFFLALKKESVPDFQKLLMSREQVAIWVSEEQLLEDFKKKHNDVPIDSLKNFVKKFIASDELYKMLRIDDEGFNYTLARGVLIDIKWPEANWKSSGIDSSQRNEDGKIYKGTIYFTCKGKSFIIEQEYIKIENTYILSKILVPYLDPLGTFQEKITAFLNDEIKSRHYIYSETAYKKDKIDSTLLKSSSVEFVKGKVLKNTDTKQEFHFLFLKYKDEEGRKAARVKLNELLKLNIYSRESEEIKTAKYNRTVYFLTPTELVILKANCSSKKENWLELRNDLVSEFNGAVTIENYCVSGNDFMVPPLQYIPPPPPPPPLMPTGKH